MSKKQSKPALPSPRKPTKIVDQKAELLKTNKRLYRLIKKGSEVLSMFEESEIKNYKTICELRLKIQELEEKLKKYVQ